MEKDATPYLPDIRKYEEVLARDPRSFCFAPLSDVYRKIGRLDDALEVALRGCEMHPGYIGGYMALGRACFEKGLFEESRQALQKVVKAMPDNALAHSLLDEIDRILAEATAFQSEGDVSSAKAAEDSWPPVEPPPANVGTKMEQEVELGWGTGFFSESVALPDAVQEQMVFDDEDIIELTDVVDDEDEGLVLPTHGQKPAIGTPEPSSKPSPLSTVTIAELYVSQGFTDRALAIYRELLAVDPENGDVQHRITALTQVLGKQREAAAEVPSVFDAPTAAVEPAERSDGNTDKPVPDQETVLETLEGWLANIRRRR